MPSRWNCCGHRADEALGVGAAGAAEIGDRHLALLRAELAIDLQLDRQAMAVVADDVRRVEPGHRSRLDDEILQDLVHRRADVDVAVGVGRAVVQHELRRACRGARGSSRRGPSAAQRASVSGSLVGRLAFIGKSVRGRLTVSFHSGMGIRRFYNDLMLRRRDARQRSEGAGPGRAHRAAGLGVVLVQGRSKDERPGLTGVSHWVEHMNFKGTTNIPRDQVKGIIEQFGGSWNGYTWIDQTTYLETATRDALDRMLFIESERMANCLYHPEDCESERTVIISELQGGENDPDQLLDQELTATAFKAHPYRHPTIGWLSDLQTMTRDDLYGYYRRYYVPEQRDAGDRRRRRHRRGAAPRRAPFRRHPAGADRRAHADHRAGADRRAAR